jgi:multiple sugar transport system substrate-binding protein
VIFRKSQQKEASWKLIEFLSRPRSRHVSIRSSATCRRVAAPGARRRWPTIRWPQRSVTSWSGSSRRRRCSEWERIVQEMRIVTEKVVRGGLPQDKAVEELDQRVDKVLAKRRWMHEQQRLQQRAPSPRSSSAVAAGSAQ